MILIGYKGAFRLLNILAFTTMMIFAISCREYKSTVTVTNRADEAIRVCSITLGSQSSKIRDIGPNEKRQLSFKVQSDDHYVISVTMQSGRRIEKEMGYVTNGMDFFDSFIIQDSDIVFNRNTIGDALKE